MDSFNYLSSGIVWNFYLVEVKWNWELVALWYQVDVDEAVVLITQL